MLKHLYIRNYALIDELDIDFGSGFSVITGETGAGKSIILGALGLLLGQRADTKAVKAGSGKCTIEARYDVGACGLAPWFETEGFDYDAADCVVRRELTAAGKSRAFINDTPATLAQMRWLGEHLVDIHSQHQNLLLARDNFQLSVLDTLAANSAQREAYGKAYLVYREAVARLEQTRAELAAARDNEDFMRFQLDELTRAALTAGEQEELETEQSAATHAEEIKAALFEADGLLNTDATGALAATRQAAVRLAAAAKNLPAAEPLAARLDSALIELKDIAAEVTATAENVDFDPERLAYVSERLDTLYTLERKFHCDTDAALVAERDRLQTAVDRLDSSDLSLTEQEAEVERQRQAAQTLADALTATRQAAARDVESEMCRRLEPLGMPNVVFVAEMSQGPLAAGGQDTVSFLFSANRGMPPRPVAQIASGGETARLMLALKAMISTAVSLPTIVFDEIDTGVSGRVAERMADIMHEMGATAQVMSITHLPQIAAAGQAHYKVEKHDTEAGTVTTMRRLTPSERIDEIAQMLSGADITDAARAAAKELLA